MKTPRSPLSNTCSDVAGLISHASHSRSTELLESLVTGRILTLSELCKDISPAKVPKGYLSPNLFFFFYGAQGVKLLPPEHVAEPERALNKLKRKKKNKGKDHYLMCQASENQSQKEEGWSSIERTYCCCDKEDGCPLEAQTGELVVGCKTEEETLVRLFEELNTMGKVVNDERFLIVGWLQARPKEGFWQDRCPELQKEETKKGEGTLEEKRGGKEKTLRKKEVWRIFGRFWRRKAWRY